VVDRRGNIVEPADGLGFAGVFVAEGLQEYYKATRDQASMELALESLKRFFNIYDDANRDVPQWYLTWCYPGMRTLGYEEMTIRVLTQVLKQLPDPGLETRLACAVDVVIHRFWNAERRLNNEVLTHDYQLPTDGSQNFFYLGHSIVTFWMIMMEAMRKRDRSLFDLAAERFRRHVEAAWDDVYGGLFRGIYLDGTPVSDKRLWVLDEALIGTMIIIEHTDLEWPLSWFNRVYHCVEDKFSLKQYGFPLWILEADRKITFEPRTARKGNYHHPRQLMLNLLALERMSQRKGVASELWN
jgi:mannose/cellobiose epimerase-like protein (N-acyl-D-glucosamine 2-epimerase family)